MTWTQVADLSGADGADGAPGADGVSITSAVVDGSGDLIVTLSDASEVNAGNVIGPPGGGIDFETSVATEANLPTTDAYGTARYVQDVGHLFVWEADGGGVGVDGWTDVGPIRGETGATGAPGTDGTDGADGVSVTNATVNGSGDLIITLSAGGPVNAGHVVGATGATGNTGSAGAPGADGADGTDGAPGAGWQSGSGTPSAAPSNNLVFYLDEATGVVYHWTP